MSQRNRIRVASSTSSSTTARGRLFEKLSKEVLEELGYRIDKTPSANYGGMEIDLEGKHCLFDIPVVAECKLYTSPIDSPQIHTFIGKYNIVRNWSENAHGVFIAIPRLNPNAKAIFKNYISGKPSNYLAVLDEDEIVKILRRRRAHLSLEFIKSKFSTEFGAFSDWEILYTDLGMYWMQYVILPGAAQVNSYFIINENSYPLSKGESLDLLQKLSIDLDGLACLDLSGRSISIKAAIASAEREQRADLPASYIDEYVAYMIKNGAAPRTIKSYKLGVQQYEKLMMSSLVLASTEDLERFVSILIDRKIKPQSVQKAINVMKSFMKFCLVKEFIHNDPTIKLGKVKLIEREVKRATTGDLDKLEASLIPETLRDYRDAAIISCLIYTGMKPSELVQLNFNDFNSSTGTLRISDKRTLPVHPALIERLTAWTERHPLKTGYLFIDLRSEKQNAYSNLTYNGIRHILHARARKAGLDRHTITSNTIRNALVGRMANNSNINLADAQKFLGYKSSTTIVKHVKNSNLEHLRDHLT